MELLVVITIIAILVAIAIPVITSVKRTGLQAKSVSRLRDLQRANIQYAGEHDQFYVPIWDMDPAVNQPWFLNPDFLRYLGADPSGCWWGNSPENVHSPLVPLNISQGMGVSYGINSDSLGWPPEPRHMTRDVPSPSRMLAFAESQDWHVNEWGSNGHYKVPEAYSGATVAYRYNKMTNAAFFDGHVETLPTERGRREYDVVEGAGITDRQSPFTPAASESRQKTPQAISEMERLLKLHARAPAKSNRQPPTMKTLALLVALIAPAMLRAAEAPTPQQLPAGAQFVADLATHRRTRATEAGHCVFQDGPPRPLLVWIHGGAFSGGETKPRMSRFGRTDDRGFAVATINYR